MTDTCTRRDFLRLAGVGAAAMALPLPHLLAEVKRKPNVIVILSDDHGYSEKGVRLYNLKDDPSEKNDLSAKYPEKIKELQAAWDQWNSKNAKPMWPAKQDAPWVDSEW